MYSDGFDYAVPLSALRVWAGNPRKTIDAAKLDELAVSIKAIGIQQPIVARPCDTGLEVIAGQRRYLAASLAGLATVPCIVRQLDDEQALEVALAENAARADVSPIEEAESIEAYLAMGRTIQQTADRLGRTVQWVERRMRLLSLTPAWRSRVLADECPLRHAELLAGLAAAAQDTLHSRFANRELPAFYEFERTVQLSLHQLSEAPFPLADESYPGGSCDACPSRSDKQRDLFSAEADEDASCLAPACWAAKVEHLWETAQRAAKKRKLRVLTTQEAALFDNGTTAPRSEWIEMERAKKFSLTARAVSRTMDGAVVELASRAEYDQAAEAALASLRAEADARKAAAEAKRATQPAPAAEPEDAGTAPTVPPSAPDDEDAQFDRERAQREIDAATYARDAETLAVFISATDGTGPARRRALLRFIGLGIKDGSHAGIAKAMGFDDWTRDVETEDVRTLLDALLIDNVIAQAKLGEVDSLCGVAPAAPAPADDGGVARMVARFEGEIAAARTSVNLGDAWVAIEAEDHRASLPTLAKLWLAKATELGIDRKGLAQMRKNGCAPVAALAKEAA